MKQNLTVPVTNDQRQIGELLWLLLIASVNWFQGYTQFKLPASGLIIDFALGMMAVNNRFFFDNTKTKLLTKKNLFC